MARQKYRAHLDRKTSEEETEEKAARKRNMMDAIDGVKAKKRRLEKDIKSLTETSDGLLEKAEHVGKIRFLTQANSMRKTVKE